MHRHARLFSGIAFVLTAGLTASDLPAQQDRAAEIARIEQKAAEINERNRVTEIVNEGIDLYHRDQPAAALAKFQQAMNQGYRSPDIHFFLGMSHAARGDARPALTELGRYLDLDPGGEFEDRAVDLINRIVDQIPGAGNP